MVIDVASIDRTLRSAKRYQEILSVLFHFGFEDIVVETGLRSWLKTHTKLDLLPARHQKYKDLTRPQRLRHVMEELGPTFVKIGQILSTRPDLIDPEFAKELKNLQYACAPADFAEVEELLKEQFGPDLQEVFQQINPVALAAASIAQVHEATLLDGTQIVIKVLRPHVEETIEADIEVLQGLARFAEKYFVQRGYSPKEVVNEFSRELRREIDLIHEGKATERLGRYFDDNPHIQFPRVYWRATTRKVLGLQKIEGTLLSHMSERDFSSEEIRALVKNCADAVFRQCFEFGYFHADPHPGNIFILSDGDVCFIDCGMTGRIDQRTSEQLANLIAGVVTADLDRVINMTLAISGADRSLVSNRTFRADVWDFILAFENTTLSTLDIGNVLESLFALLQRHHIRCPSDLVFLIKAITTIEGVAEELDPAFDIVGYVKPYLESLIKQRYGLAAIKKRFEMSLVEYLELVEDLPGAFKWIVSQIRSNSFSVQLDHHGLDRLTDTVHKASKNISVALISAAIMVGSAILILADNVSKEPSGFLQNLGFVGVLAGFVLTIWILFTHTSDRE